jgi:hypothetical protein
MRDLTIIMNTNLRTFTRSVLFFISIAGVFASGAASGVFAQTGPAPAALVADLYKQHKANKSPFFQDKDRALVDKYFTRATADLIWKDSTTSSGEVGALDGDPLYDAQDTDIKRLAVGKAAISGEKATVVVTFLNFNKKKTVTFALVKESGAWKIDDISYGTDYTLVSLLKEDAGSGEEAVFGGEYRVGPATCTIKPVKMAFEARWKNGKGAEMYFFKGTEDGKSVFETESDKTGKSNKFVMNDGYSSGTFYRSDGKEFEVGRVK